MYSQVQDQFNCASLLGAQLENQGGQEAANNHWEFELFQGELMTAAPPVDRSYQRISMLTLSLLVDTGW
jgi:leishmanolysin-like peptidase